MIDETGSRMAGATLERVEFYDARGKYIATRIVHVTRGFSSVPWITGPCTRGPRYHRPLLKAHDGAWVIWLNDEERPPLGAVAA